MLAAIDSSPLELKSSSRPLCAALTIRITMTIPNVPSSRFIPFRTSDLIAMCRDDRSLGEQAPLFERFSHMLSHVFHAEFKQELDELNRSYASLDPDADTRLVFPAEEIPPVQFVDQLKGVLDKANFEAISKEELERAMNRSSLFNLRLDVDFDDFSEVLLFCRGASLRKETVKTLYGLRSKEVEFINYDRVVVYVRYKEDAIIDEADKKINEKIRPGATLLKLFQNVPRADLEMLFPNTQLQMRLQDKLLIGIPAVVSGGIVLTTKLGATLLLLSSMIGFWFGLRQEPVELSVANLMVLVAGVGALGAYLWQQFSKFKNQKILFMKQLTQNLYFKNLDNNAGVIFRLLHDAEEEEVKEALLAYYFLLKKGPLSRSQLDQTIEQWLSDQWQCTMDFEIDDAMQKLQRLELVIEKEGLYQAVPLTDATATLSQRWTDYLV